MEEENLEPKDNTVELNDNTDDFINQISTMREQINKLSDDNNKMRTTNAKLLKQMACTEPDKAPVVKEYTQNDIDNIAHDILNKDMSDLDKMKKLLEYREMVKSKYGVDVAQTSSFAFENTDEEKSQLDNTVNFYQHCVDESNGSNLKFKSEYIGNIRQIGLPGLNRR